MSLENNPQGQQDQNQVPNVRPGILTNPVEIEKFKNEQENRFKNQKEGRK